MYEYRATLLRVVDGDTVDLMIDLGCFVSVARRIRLYGVNTPELRDPVPGQRVAAIKAKKFTADYLPLASKALTITTRLDAGDKYGRLLGTIHADPAQPSLNDALLTAGLAVPYMVENNP